MRTQLINEVRKKYQLPKKKSVFFSKDEVQHIVEEITGKSQTWTDCGDYMETYLSSYGWQNQQTIDTHPNIENLNWLLTYESSDTLSFNVKDLVKNLPSEIADQFTGISIKEDSIVFYLR